MDRNFTLDMGDTLLEARDLGKIYSRSRTETRLRIGTVLRQVMIGAPSVGGGPLRKQEFWALKDINVKLKRGDALGIIGLNGSGKTTLLRMLAGQIVPDSGVIRVWGRTASMIDLTAGFQMAASGRRNIYLRGAALGRSRAEIDASFEEIIAFAELGNAIDAPVATYSSGMTMRLAFSIMVMGIPDILLIDEVLTVGDYRFRQRCLEKLRKIREHSSFVLVSHSLSDVRSFCSNVIVLNNGQIVFEGEPDEAIAIYENLQFPEPVTREKKIKSILAPEFVNVAAISDVENYWSDEDGRPIESVRSGDPVFFSMAMKLEHTPRQLVIGIPVWTADGAYVTGFSTEHCSREISVDGGKRSAFQLHIPALWFNPGAYISNLVISDGPECLHRKQNPVLEVTPRYTKTWGMVTLPQDWQTKESQ